MTDFRSDAEKFVTAFLDYVQTYDIQDLFDKRTQKMTRSPGVDKLVKQAQAVFPPRVDDGKAETDKLTDDQVTQAIAAAPGVVLDRRDVFSRKIAQNGSAQGLLKRVLEGDVEAVALAQELVAADKGDKQFLVEED